MKDSTPVCRSCRSSNLEQSLSLGSTPLADALLKEEDLSGVEATYPLDVVFCHDCSLMQILETVPPEELFCRDYPYFSSFSDTVVNNAAEITGLHFLGHDLAASGIDAFANNDKAFIKANPDFFGGRTYQCYCHSLLSIVLVSHRDGAVSHAWFRPALWVSSTDSS